MAQNSREGHQLTGRVGHSDPQNVKDAKDAVLWMRKDAVLVVFPSRFRRCVPTGGNWGLLCRGCRESAPKVSIAVWLCRHADHLAYSGSGLSRGRSGLASRGTEAGSLEGGALCLRVQFLHVVFTSARGLKCLPGARRNGL